MGTKLTALTADADPTKDDLVYTVNTPSGTPASRKATVFNLLKQKVQAVTSSATVTPNADTDDMVVITAQAAGLTLANPSGTPTQGQKLLVRIKDNGTARAISYGTQYRAVGEALPTTTVISKLLYIGFFYNSTDTKWDCVASKQEA